MTKLFKQNYGKIKRDVWFVYDGECPICSATSNAIRIKKNVGDLHLLNARENEEHPIIKEINIKGFDLDRKMVVKFQETFFHGADALHIIALLGTNSDWLNCLNSYIFRSKILCFICYPFFRSARNLALKLKGASQIRNLDHKN